MSRSSVTSGRAAVAAAVGLGLLLLASCGTGSQASDTDLVAASLLRQSDLPGDLSWTVAEEETDPQAERLDADLDDCERQHDPTVRSARAEQESDAFETGDLTSASSTGWVVEDPVTRDAFFDSLDEQFACMGRALTRFLRRAFPSGISIEVAQPYALDVESDADRGAGRAIQIGMSLAGSDDGLTIFLDVIAVEEGPLLAAYAFLHQGEITQEDEMDTVAAALSRVGALE